MTTDLTTTTTPAPAADGTESAAAPSAPATTVPATSDSQTLGILSLIGGIAGIAFGQTVVIPIAAIVLGFLARRSEPRSRVYATWGIVLGFFSLFGWVIALLLGLALFAPLAALGFAVNL